MATMNISLPDEMKEFIEAQMSRDGFASASEYFRTLVREEQKRRARRELEARFLEALESGPAEPMTREDWDSLENRVWERHRQEHGPS
jgi:antitoxin ParD1/3/4